MYLNVSVNVSSERRQHLLKISVRWMYIPRGCLDSTGTDTADTVSPLDASLSCLGCAKSRTSWGSGWEGAAFKPGV